MAAAHDIGYPVALKSFDESLRHRLDQSGVRLGLLLRRPADGGLRRPVGGRRTVAVRAGDGRAGPRPRCRRCSGSAPTRRSARWSRSASAAWRPNCCDDRAYRAVPLTDADAADLIAAPRAAPLLDGYRGARPVVRGAAGRPGAAAVRAGRRPARGRRPAAAAGAGRTGRHRGDRRHGPDRAAAGSAGHPAPAGRLAPAAVGDRLPGRGPPRGRAPRRRRPHPAQTAKDRVHPAADPVPPASGAHAGEAGGRRKRLNWWC